MADELSQLDEIVESDILDALGESPTPPSSNEEIPSEDTIEQDIETSITEDEIKIEDFEDETAQEISADTNDEDEIKIEDFIEEANSEVIDEPKEDISKELEEPQEVTKDSQIDDIKEILPIDKSEESNTTTIEASSSSIVSIINELLKNKTIEITIKIKE